MKSPKWVAITRQLIKSKHGFGWSISGWERNNKLITKVVDRYQDGSRNSVLADLNWASNNSGKIIDLVEDLASTKATPILLHHASGGNAGERAVKASRGTKALPAEASQILELDWLIPEDKHDNRVTISSAGRNSTPVDMVIEQVDRAVWVNLGSKSEIAENLRLEIVKEESLNLRLFYYY